MIYLLGESNPRSKSYERFSIEEGVKDNETYVINDDPAHVDVVNKQVKAIATLVGDITVVSFFKDDDLFRVAIDAGVPVIMDEQHQEIDREHKRNAQIDHDTMAYKPLCVHDEPDAGFMLTIIVSERFNMVYFNLVHTGVMTHIATARSVSPTVTDDILFTRIDNNRIYFSDSSYPLSSLNIYKD